MPCSTFRAARTAAIVACVFTVACENLVGGGRIQRTDNRPADGGQIANDGGVIDDDIGTAPVDAQLADTGTDGGINPKPDLGVPDMGSVDTGLVFDPVTRATVGTKCEGTDSKLFIVLTDAAGSCTEDAMRLLSPPGAPVVIYAELPNPPALGTISVVANVCLDANCEMRDLQLDLTAVEVGTRIAGNWLVQLADSQAAGAFDAAWCDYDAINPASGVVADGLSLAEVSVYQSVKVNIVENANEVTNRNAPLISSRPGLVRVFVDRATGFVAHDVVARLTLDGPNQTREVLEETVNVTQDSTETVGDSTFNFFLSENQIKAGTTYHLGLYEPDAACGASTPGDAVFPASGMANLNTDASGTLKIVLVPVRYNADGSGRVSDTSPAQLDRYRDLMWAMFPLAGLDVTVHAPFDFNGAVQRDGTGWSALLQAVLALRNNENAPGDTYYYGIFDPAASFNAYCQGSCVAGLGPVPPRNDTYARGSIGMGFGGQSAAETFTHEIGHSLGRRHAPCMVSNGDPNFPYTGGRLGVYGFDIVTNELKDPDDNRDLMGYCDPTWISDYNYEAVHDRLAFVLPLSPIWSPPRQPYRSLLQSEGAISFGSHLEFEFAPQGQREEGAWIQVDGSRLPVSVVVVPLDHVADELMLVQEPPAEAVQLELRNQLIDITP